MSEQERQIKAQEVFQATLQTLAQTFGMTVEAVLQVEAISDAYVTSRAVLVLKTISNWQASVIPKDKS